MLEKEESKEIIVFQAYGGEFEALKLKLVAMDQISKENLKIFLEELAEKYDYGLEDGKEVLLKAIDIATDVETRLTLENVLQNAFQGENEEDRELGLHCMDEIFETLDC